MKSAFGTLQTYDPVPITLVFIGVLIVVVCIDSGLGLLEYFADKHNLLKMLEKLQHELMILGFISFIMFLFNQAFINDADTNNSDYYISFETVHILILFVAFSFIFQAVILVQYANNSGREFLRIVRTPESELLTQFELIKLHHGNLNHNNSDHKTLSQRLINLQNKKGMDSLQVREFWRRVEFKIVEELFMKSFGSQIPVNFDYGNYVGYLFHQYISDVGKVSIYAWLFLACLLVINLGWCFTNRAIGVEKRFCTFDKTDELFESNLFFFNANGEHCYSFVMSYAFFCGCVLLASANLLYIVSCYYVHELFHLGAEVVYGESLPGETSFLQRLYGSMVNALDLDLSISSPSHLVYICCLHKTVFNKPNETRGSRQKTRSQQRKTVFTENPLKQTSSPSDPSAYTTVPLPTTEAPLHDMSVDLNSKICSTTAVIPANATRTAKSIFLFQKPGLYFLVVEVAFLVQSLYLSVYLTQLLPLCLAINDIGWAVGLGIIPILSFFILRHVLSKSVLLHSTTALHRAVIGRVVEEAELKRTICVDVQQLIIDAISLDNEEEQKAFVKTVFKNVDWRGTGELDKVQCRKMLIKKFKVCLSNERFELLWSVIDADMSGAMSLDELMMFVFPSEKLRLEEGHRIAYEVCREFCGTLAKRHVPKDKWAACVKDAFTRYDADGSGEIDRTELCTMLEEFHVTVSGKMLDYLLETIDTTGNPELVTLEEFTNLVLPDPRHQSIKQASLRDLGLATVNSTRGVISSALSYIGVGRTHEPGSAGSSGSTESVKSGQSLQVELQTVGLSAESSSIRTCISPVTEAPVESSSSVELGE